MQRTKSGFISPSGVGDGRILTAALQLMTRDKSVDVQKRVALIVYYCGCTGNNITVALYKDFYGDLARNGLQGLVPDPTAIRTNGGGYDISTADRKRRRQTKRGRKLRTLLTDFGIKIDRIARHAHSDRQRQEMLSVVSGEPVRRGGHHRDDRDDVTPPPSDSTDQGRTSPYEMAVEIATLKDEHSREIAKIKAQYKADMDRMMAEITARIDALQPDDAAVQAIVAAALAQQAEDHAQAHKAEIGSLRAEMQATVESMHEMRTEIEQVKSFANASVESVADDVSEIRTRITKVETRGSPPTNRQITGLNCRLSALSKELSDDIAMLKSKVDTELPPNAFRDTQYRFERKVQ